MNNVEQILVKLSDLGLIRLNRKIGKYFSIYCPIHNQGNERKPSCGVLLEDEIRNGVTYSAGFVHCFACGHAKSLIDTITDILKLRDINIDGRAWIKDNLGIDSYISEEDHLIPSNLIKTLNSEYAVKYIKSLTTQTSYVSEEELESYRFTCDYMYERGLTDDIINKYDVGVDLNYIPPGRKNPVPCITFPVRDSKGNTLFILRRSIEGKAFYLPISIQKPVYGLFELSNNNDKIIITESCFNTLTCVKYGISSVSLLGTGTSYQINQLRCLQVSEFILGLDPDEAGDRAYIKLKRQLKNIAIVKRMQIPKNKDINDLSYEEFFEAYNNRI